MCSGFLIGTQFRQGRRTLGIIGFFIDTPSVIPPMGGGGGMGGAPARVVKLNFINITRTLVQYIMEECFVLTYQMG